MILDKNTKILIIGLGMIGGSYAMALKKKGYAVSAITRSPSTIDWALEHGIIDKGTCKVDPEFVGEADLVVSGLYPHTFIEWIRDNQHLFKKGAVITDVTGVKGSITSTIQGMLRDDLEFIAAHPMAGRERSGVKYSDDGVFKNANYIVVPTEKNTEKAVEICRALGETLGFANISVLSPDRHDEMIAFLSQLTHCIAVALMCSNDDPAIKNYTGDSFRDLTRIARINDEMWSELFLANREKLLEQMDSFMGSFTKLRKTLEDGDREEMREMMRLSTARRAEFDKK